MGFLPLSSYKTHGQRCWSHQCYSWTTLLRKRERSRCSMMKCVLVLALLHFCVSVKPDTNLITEIIHGLESLSKVNFTYVSTRNVYRNSMLQSVPWLQWCLLQCYNIQFIMQLTDLFFCFFRMVVWPLKSLQDVH